MSVSYFKPQFMQDEPFHLTTQHLKRQTLGRFQVLGLDAPHPPLFNQVCKKKVHNVITMFILVTPHPTICCCFLAHMEFLHASNMLELFGF